MVVASCEMACEAGRAIRIMDARLSGGDAVSIGRMVFFDRSVREEAEGRGTKLAGHPQGGMWTASGEALAY